LWLLFVLFGANQRVVRGGRSRSGPLRNGVVAAVGFGVGVEDEIVVALCE
jgi:hypothetical protein